MKLIHLTADDTPLMYALHTRPLKELEELDFKGLKSLFRSSDQHNINKELLSILEKEKPVESLCLKKSIGLYQEMIGVFSKMSYLFHRLYCNDETPDPAIINYLNACQITLNRLQGEYNQLVYRRQIRVAYWALGLTVLFSLVSILLTLYDMFCGPGVSACSCLYV